MEREIKQQLAQVVEPGLEPSGFRVSITTLYSFSILLVNQQTQMETRVSDTGTFNAELFIPLSRLASYTGKYGLGF